eukprot:gene9319-biopygen4263
MRDVLGQVPHGCQRGQPPATPDMRTVVRIVLPRSGRCSGTGEVHSDVWVVPVHHCADEGALKSGGHVGSHQGSDFTRTESEGLI